MSKAKTLMVSFLGVSLVFALMVTTIPTLATAETLAPSEPGVSLGKPLSDSTLKECTAMGATTITVVQWNMSTGNNTQYNYVNIPTTTQPYQNTLNTSGTTNQTITKTVTVRHWVHRK